MGGLNLQILQGDCRETLKTVPDGSVQCVVTSPPYWGLRSYLPKGHPKKALEIGLETTPEAYVENLKTVFREVWRVLRDDGTLWLNLGDSYVDGGRGSDSGSTLEGSRHNQAESRKAVTRTFFKGLKPKNLLGIPWRVAFALQADGWYLRCDIIWAKPNPMPESVVDRPTKAHEYLFLFSKREKYYYDSKAIAEPVTNFNPTGSNAMRGQGHFREAGGPANRPGREIAQIAPTKKSGNDRRKIGAERGRPDGHGSRMGASIPWEGVSRNKRSVWTLPVSPFSGAHFATFPAALIKPCILAGSGGADNFRPVRRQRHNRTGRARTGAQSDPLRTQRRVHSAHFSAHGSHAGPFVYITT